MKYGYARGTAEQIKSQISDLLSAGVQTIFCDCGQRTQKDRTGYRSLMGIVKKGDIIAVTDMSRLTKNWLSILELEEKGIIIDFLTEGRSIPGVLKESVIPLLKNNLLLGS